MKRIICSLIVTIMLLAAATTVYAQPASESTYDQAINEQRIVSPLQLDFIERYFDVDLDNSNISIISTAPENLARSMVSTQANKKAIKCVSELSDTELQVTIIVPMLEDENGRLVNAFELRPNYLTEASLMATRSTSTSNGSIPDLYYRVIGNYSREVISSNYVYRFLSAQFKWWRKDSSSSYKVNRFILNAAVCGDLYDTSFNLIKEDYEKMKTLDKSSPTIDTYYNTGTIMAAQGNVVTVSGFYQGATMDWEYWIYNSDGSNVRDIGSHKVFGP